MSTPCMYRACTVHVHITSNQMEPQQQSIAIGAGLCGVAALVGAPGFIVATGCGLLIRECFRDPADYKDATTEKDYSQIKYNKIRF